MFVALASRESLALVLSVIMIEGMFGFDIDRKFSFNHELLFKVLSTGL